TSPYAAKFSLPFMVASSLIDGKARHSTFSAQNIQREELLNLAGKVKYRIAKPDETTFPAYFPGWLRVQLNDGRVLEERMDQNLGTPANPLSRSDLEAKFMDNTAGLDVDASQIMSVFEALDEARIRDVQELLGTTSVMAE